MPDKNLIAGVREALTGAYGVDSKKATLKTNRESGLFSVRR